MPLMDQSTFANHLQSPLSMSPALLLAFERLVRVRRFSSVLFKVPHVLGQAQATRITAVFLHLRTNAFYPMTPQDTMRPFCLFSQIRARSHTNTNINIPSSEWATKYLVGEFTWKRFCAFCNDLLWAELDSTLHWPGFLCFLTWDLEKLVCSAVMWSNAPDWSDTVGNRVWSCPKVLCAVGAYKCHKIPWWGPKEHGVSVFLIVCHLFWSLELKRDTFESKQHNKN